eukprot:TRINITY_DN21359_c0_g1_i2.p1 TRINITY_DN21359_c0_g1~~TRINITY_DN21359_c0_g1_i2.p1  ORF type:complete len:834 (-),score=140.58 TRINITY_DN21359_c0_g1_i2:60-2390(-)
MSKGRETLNPSVLPPGAASLVSLHASPPVAPAADVDGRAGEELSAHQNFQCSDTPNWANGWSGCAFDRTYGKNSSLCALTPGAGWPSTRGWTCKQYENMGWCKNGQALATFAMGETLQFPEQNCCACGGGNVKSQCKVDTEQNCAGGVRCSAWRGSTRCYKDRCLCMPGYCLGEAGVCHLVESSSSLRLQPQCDRITDDHCSKIQKPLAIARGTATCDTALRKAVCNPGMCSDPQSFCFKGMGIVEAEVAPVNEDHPIFPGRQAQVKSALCFSGGGSRAAATAIGVLRSMSNKGFLDKFDALSSVSGGSWASAIFMFADRDLTTLLGKATNPADLNLTVLDHMEAQALSVFTNSTTRISEHLTNLGMPSERLWVEATSTAFLEPFGLGRLDAFMAADADQVASIKARNPQYRNATFLVPRPGRPRAFVMSGSALAPDQYQMSNKNTVSLQMSPDFSGQPFVPNNSPLSFKPSAFLGLPELHNMREGGGLIESFAFGAPAPLPKDQDGGAAVKLQAPITPFSLARAVGISSAAFGGFLSKIGRLGEAFDPQTSLWPLTTKEDNVSQQAMTFQLGDGACIDNTGLLAMLQRGASKIVMVVASENGLKTAVDWCAVDASHPGLGGAIDNSFANKFGYEPGGLSDLTVAVKNNQVFDKVEYQPLLCLFYQLKKAGKPMTVVKNLQVRENKWWGIKGGYVAEVLFVMLDKVEEFNNQLPADTQKALKLGPAGGLYPFPGFKTILQNAGELTAYTPRQLNLLSAQAEYMVNQASSQLADLLK